MQLIQAPERARAAYGRSVFLAGGITGCPGWQRELIDLLLDKPITLYNPRQPNFDVRNPSASDAQVEWEFDMLHEAGAVSFWFPCETLCPITLLELGKSLAGRKPLYVGAHPDYARRFDVVKQTSLAAPGVIVVSTLRALADQIKSIPREHPIDRAARLLGV